jgi:hypothetical protein
MGIEPEYRELFSESVTLLPKVSVDKYGRRTHAGSAVPIAAHIVSETRLYLRPDGREVVETGRVYLYGSFTDIDSDYLIILPDGSSPVIIGTDTPHDNIGAHHTVVRVGK